MAPKNPITIDGVTLGFVRRRYGKRTYTWVWFIDKDNVWREVTACDPWPSINIPKKDLQELVARIKAQPLGHDFVGPNLNSCIVQDCGKPLSAHVPESEHIVGQSAPLPAHIPDFTVQNEGTIYLLYAQTDAARAWVTEHLPADRQTWGGNGTVVEHRYICDIVDGIRADGLSVR